MRKNKKKYGLKSEKISRIFESFKATKKSWKLWEIEKAQNLKAFYKKNSWKAYKTFLKKSWNLESSYSHEL